MKSIADVGNQCSPGTILINAGASGESRGDACWTFKPECPARFHIKSECPTDFYLKPECPAIENDYDHDMMLLFNIRSTSNTGDLLTQRVYNY